jgi:hypothetical protein
MDMLLTASSRCAYNSHFLFSGIETMSISARSTDLNAYLNLLFDLNRTAHRLEIIFKFGG